MVGLQQPPQMYPLGEPEPNTDKRFTFGLVVEVADVLAKHGYPDILANASGADALNLEQALFTFIYGRADDSGRHVLGCAIWSSPRCTCGGEVR